MLSGMESVGSVSGYGLDACHGNRKDAEGCAATEVQQEGASSAPLVERKF